jgi:TonB family protein
MSRLSSTVLGHSKASSGAEVQVSCISKLTKLRIAALALALMTLVAVNLSAQESRKAISRPSPVYPEAARRLFLSGTVKVQVVIASDGHIKETKVIGGHPLLVAAVEETLKDWKYEPATKDSAVLLEFHFHP